MISNCLKQALSQFDRAFLDFDFYRCVKRIDDSFRFLSSVCSVGPPLGLPDSFVQSLFLCMAIFVRFLSFPLLSLLVVCSRMHDIIEANLSSILSFESSA